MSSNNYTVMEKRDPLKSQTCNNVDHSNKLNYINRKKKKSFQYKTHTRTHTQTYTRARNVQTDIHVQT